MNVTNTKQIIKALNDLTTDQLLEVNKELNAIYDKRKKEEISIIKSMIKAGDIVTVDHPTVAGKEYEVQYLNRTKAVLKPAGLTESQKLLTGKTVVRINMLRTTQNA